MGGNVLMTRRRERAGGKMQLRSWIAWVAGITVLAWSTVAVVQAQTVTFLDITDAVPGKYFDAATTAPDPLNPNRLIFGFHTGLDVQTWISRTFTASTAAFYRASAMDTIRFLVAAPPGYYIAAISYTQRGIGTMARTSKATGGATWVVDDIAEDLGLFGANPALSHTLNLKDQHRTLVPVSITCGLFAFAPPLPGFATISITSAEVLVELLPLPQ
jgi:hypothetical protein